MCLFVCILFLSDKCVQCPPKIAPGSKNTIFFFEIVREKHFPIRTIFKYSNSSKGEGSNDNLKFFRIFFFASKMDFSAVDANWIRSTWPIEPDFSSNMNLLENFEEGTALMNCLLPYPIHFFDYDAWTSKIF